MCELRNKHRSINGEQQQQYEESVLPDDGNENIEIIVLSKKSADRENVELYNVQSLQQQPTTNRRSQAAVRKQIANCPTDEYQITYTEEMPNESAVDRGDVRLCDVRSLQQLPTTNRQSPAADHREKANCPTADYEINYTEGRVIEISAPNVSEVVIEEVEEAEEEEDEEDGVSFLLNTLQQADADNPELDIINPAKSVRTKRRRSSTDATTSKVKTATTGDEKRKHQCNVCDKAFMRKSNLVDHLRLHANVRPYECEVCTLSFVQIGNLRAHMRVHTKERPYKCEVCKKTYNQSGALKVHMRVHTNERNYKCAECDKAFTNSSDRNKHQRVHDLSSQIECPLCEDRKFAQRVNYMLHMRKYHPGADPSVTKAVPKKIKK